jgi:hypothetical protein
MKYLPDMTRTYGYQMSDREPERKERRCQHGFVTAEQYVREQPLTASMADMGVAHTFDSKRPVRSIADMIGAHQVNKTSRNKLLNPNLRKRQTMESIKCT